MSDEILSIGTWNSNAEMIAEVQTLGYFDKNTKGAPGSVFDATYGPHGGFWKVWKPETLFTNDLYHPADYADDYRALPWPDCNFDVVVFDAPYKLNGTPAMGEMDDRYGTAGKTNRDDVMEDIRLGAIECFRVCRRRLMVKCMDQVEGGQMRWQTHMVANAIEELGGRWEDRFDIPTAGVPQPTTRTCPTCNGDYERVATPEEVDAGCELGIAFCRDCVEGKVDIVQRTSHGKHSTLLVFWKPAKLRTRRTRQATLL